MVTALESINQETPRAGSLVGNGHALLYCKRYLIYSRKDWLFGKFSAKRLNHDIWTNFLVVLSANSPMGPGAGLMTTPPFDR